MADESGEIILETQDDSEADEATSPTACSGASMDDILQALHSLGKQNNGIQNKMEQQGWKSSLKYRKYRSASCTRVNAQATQLENGLKLHEDKLMMKINALVEKYPQKENSLDSKQSLFEENVEQAKANSRKHNTITMSQQMFYY